MIRNLFIGLGFLLALAGTAAGRAGAPRRSHGRAPRSSPSATCSTMPASSPRRRLFRAPAPGTTGIVTHRGGASGRARSSASRRSTPRASSASASPAPAAVVDEPMPDRTSSPPTSPQRGIVAAGMIAEPRFDQPGSRHQRRGGRSIRPSSSTCATCPAAAQFSARFLIAGHDAAGRRDRHAST